MKLFISLSRMWDKMDIEVQEALNKAHIDLDASGSFVSSSKEGDDRINLFLDLLKSVKFRRILPQNTEPDTYYYVKASVTVRITNNNELGHSTIFSITSA